VEVRKSLGRRIKLDTLAEGTLKKNKSGHGLEAITWWKNGEINKIIKYCIDDVKITKELYEYALKHKKLKYPEGTTMREVKLDTSSWEKPNEGAAMTFSLPF
jgi:DEAD/DEAH box helicase domain-containing protein